MRWGLVVLLGFFEEGVGKMGGRTWFFAGESVVVRW
jgi:hypothetical protein